MELVTKSDKVYKCSDCNKTFASTSGLSRHIQHYTGQYSHFCDVCRRGFNNSTQFNDHVRGHEGKGYPCGYCGKKFKKLMRQRYHLSEHTGLYRLFCNVCKKGYNEKGPFVKHMEAHKQ